jgi:hypothetical protein
MTQRAICSILSFDYLDFDVYLNSRLFYRLAGYKISAQYLHPDTRLLVLLRGHPSCYYPHYTGLVHVYDYVREYHLNYRSIFPNATAIICISLIETRPDTPIDKYIEAYLPVFPKLWQFSLLPSSHRSTTPIHISNYKPIGDDHYQQSLIELIQSGDVHVFGGRWNSLQIHARPLSYFSANSLLSKSLVCFGLMYPYQRGASLSGRMWQAPINGCLVLSETGTNIYSVPGVIEVESFDSYTSIQPYNPLSLAAEATDFWKTKTNQLALLLNLSLDSGSIDLEILFSRLILLRQHLEFLCTQYLFHPLLRLRSKFSKVLRDFARSLS